MDVFGYYKPVKRMTLRAGVYNLFNRKYHTWDSLRGINPRSTINSLSVRDAKSAAQGLERYYAPAATMPYRWNGSFNLVLLN